MVNIPSKIIFKTHGEAIFPQKQFASAAGFGDAGSAPGRLPLVTAS
jgi:hypothetical protein